jgi:hypothetical protein
MQRYIYFDNQKQISLKKIRIPELTPQRAPLSQYSV